MRRSRSVISFWVPWVMASGVARSLPQGGPFLPRAPGWYLACRGPPVHEPVFGPAARPLRDRRSPRRRGDGRGLHRPRHPARPAGRGEGAASRPRLGPRPARALRARGEGHLGPQPPARRARSSTSGTPRGPTGRSSTSSWSASRARRSPRASRAAPCRSPRRWCWESSSPGRSPRRTAGASSTATSSPGTSCSRARARSCSTSASPGTARATRCATAEEDVTATLATEAQPLTHVGTLVGTWPYLAPEQVQGRPADARSDVFALGCVLFEALAGRRAFPGATRAEITAGILGTEPPDLREVAPGTPAALAALVRQCLAKDPDARWQCADDVARGLRLVEEGAAEAGRGPPARRAPPGGRSRSARWASPRPPLPPSPWCAARGPSSPCASRWPPPAGVLLSRPTMVTPFAVSPDGRRIAFTGGVGGESSLWLWSAEDGQAAGSRTRPAASRPSSRPTGATSPSSPPTTCGACRSTGTGDHHCCGSGGQLGDVGQRGNDSRHATPGRGRRDLLGSGPRRRARLIARAASPRDRQGFARFLPDGHHYLFLKGYGQPVADRRLCVGSLDGGEPDCFASCPSQAEYSGSGHVLCVRAGTLVALPFDARSRKPTGEAIAVARDVRLVRPERLRVPSFAVSADGTTLVHEPRPADSASSGSTGAAARRRRWANPALSASCSSRPMAVGSRWTGCSPTGGVVTSGPSTRARAWRAA